MAGHSKWNNIKHRKGAADKRRSKLFSKLAKYIMVAARSGGANPGENIRLRYAIERARAESMPKDSIDRAIKKACGELQGEALAEITYEAISAGGASLIIEVLTDNRNRTGGEIRHLLERRGASLGKTNSVAWKFERRGVLRVAKADANEEEVFEAALDAGADNIEEEGDGYDVYCPPETMESVRSALQALVERKRGRGGKKWGEAEDERPVFARNELVYLPKARVVIEDFTTARQVLDILSDLDDHEDVQNVHHDMDVPEIVLEQLSKDT
jgi:YebC/PmpR family DNA-binding regulatory protein